MIDSNHTHAYIHTDPSISPVITVQQILHLHWEVLFSVHYLPVKFTIVTQLVMGMDHQRAMAHNALKHLLS